MIRCAFKNPTCMRDELQPAAGDKSGLEQCHGHQHDQQTLIHIISKIQYSKWKIKCYFIYKI